MTDIQLVQLPQIVIPIQYQLKKTDQVKNMDQAAIMGPREIRSAQHDSNKIDNGDCILCDICLCIKPDGLASSTVFWIDHGKCGAWVLSTCSTQCDLDQVCLHRTISNLQ